MSPRRIRGLRAQHPLNVPLEPLSPEEVAARTVPPRVRARYRSFFGCPRCGATFWKGTHVRDTCRRLGLPDASEVPA